MFPKFNDIFFLKLVFTPIFIPAFQTILRSRRKLCKLIRSLKRFKGRFPDLLFALAVA